jgi:hypothetical protein
METNASAILTTTQAPLQAFQSNSHSRYVRSFSNRNLSPFVQRQRDLVFIERLERLLRWIEDYENGHGSRR